MKRQVVGAIVLALFAAIVAISIGDRAMLRATANEGTPTDLIASGNIYTAEGQFEMAILAQTNSDTGTSDVFQVASIAGVPIVESPDRSLAYTAVSRQRATDRRLSTTDLAQIALEELQRGQGFVAGTPIELAPGEIVLPWSGMMMEMPIVGRAIVIQDSARIRLLVVSASLESADRLDAALTILRPSFKAAPAPTESSSTLGS